MRIGGGIKNKMINEEEDFKALCRERKTPKKKKKKGEEEVRIPDYSEIGSKKRLTAHGQRKCP
jgi:hypothetical protein